MASVTSVVFSDDLDGKKADETVQFALDGVEYEIDLSKKNAAALRKALGEFVPVARRAGIGSWSPASARRTRRAPSGSPGKDAGNLAAIRAWAKEAGLAVASKGRISGDVRAQYESSQAQPTDPFTAAATE